MLRPLPPHIRRVSLPMEQDERPDPAQIGLLRADAVVAGPDRVTHPVEKRRCVASLLHKALSMSCMSIQYTGNRPFATPQDRRRSLRRDSKKTAAKDTPIPLISHTIMAILRWDGQNPQTAWAWRYVENRRVISRRNSRYTLLCFNLGNSDARQTCP